MNDLKIKVDFIYLKNKMKVKELMKLCLNQIKKGNAEKTIYISSDDEWNDYHELFYWFSKLEDVYVDDYRLEDIERYHKKEDVILLW